MVERVTVECRDWQYDAVSIGYPRLVGPQGPRAEPGNLGAHRAIEGDGEVEPDPPRVLNDAAMQTLDTYDGGRMLFIGLGTGVGSAFIAQHVIVPLELGGLPWRRNRAVWKTLGREGATRQARLAQGGGAGGRTVRRLGGGNAKHFRPGPSGASATTWPRFAAGSGSGTCPTCRRFRARTRRRWSRRQASGGSSDAVVAHDQASPATRRMSSASVRPPSG
jgi:hypothetical protein